MICLFGASRGSFLPQSTEQEKIKCRLPPEGRRRFARCNQICNRLLRTLTVPTGADCEALMCYLTARDERIVPGVNKGRIVVRIMPVPTSSAQRRWRDLLFKRFDAVNSVGCIYRRRIKLREGADSTTFLVVSAPLGDLHFNTTVRSAGSTLAELLSL